LLLSLCRDRGTTKVLVVLHGTWSAIARPAMAVPVEPGRSEVGERWDWRRVGGDRERNRDRASWAGSTIGNISSRAAHLVDLTGSDAAPKIDRSDQNDPIRARSDQYDPDFRRSGPSASVCRNFFRRCLCFSQNIQVKRRNFVRRSG